MNTSLENAKTLFLRDRKSYCNDSTIKFYCDGITYFLKWVDGSTLYDLSDTVLSDYIIHLKQRNITNTSINTYLRSVTVWLNWLHSHDYIDRDLVRGLRRPRSDKPEIIPLSMQEVALCDRFLLDRVYAERDFIVFHLMLDCGFRLSDVLHFEFCNFDRDKQIILLKNGKFNKSRVVPVPQFLAVHLLGYMVNHPFISHLDITRNAVKSLFQKLKSISPSLNRIHAHLLRHTFATSFLIGGGNLEMLRLILGHSDYTVTKDYVHLADFYKMYDCDIYKLDSVFFKTGY